MNTPSPDPNDPQSGPSPGSEEVVSQWVVRLFLILSFGLAFGIEGMTIIRSYVIDEEAEDPVQNSDAAQEALPLRVGDDLLPATDVTERVVAMTMRARSGKPWTFELTVALHNTTARSYRLTLRDLRTDDGTRLDASHSITCPPKDTVRLAATWPMSSDRRPQFVTVQGRLQLSSDSTQTVEQQRSIGHVPVKMMR